MRGVILAGGKGTRLLPATSITNKHLIPILNKPMIDYPLDTLISMGCRDILIVSGGDHIGHIAQYLGDGSRYGVDLTYKVQMEAGGIAQALYLAKDFAKLSPVHVILGDNIFDSYALSYLNIKHDRNLAQIFVKSVVNPQRFGVYIDDGERQFIVEKPAKPISNMAVTGLYVYPYEVFDVIETIKPSARGELEITDVNNYFLGQKRCVVHDIGRSFWSDAGTPESLYEVIKFVYES